MVKTFENGIYPISFVVAVDAKPEDICNNYCIYDKEHKPMRISTALYEEMFQGREAITFEGVCLKNCDVCIISIFSTFNGKLNIETGTIAHEACHIADKICDIHNITYGTFSNGEAHAYICGWAANCINNCVQDTLSKKPRKK